MRTALYRFLFAQPNIDFRIFVARVAVSLITVSWTLFGPFDQFHVEAATLLYRPAGLFYLMPPLGSVAYNLLRYAVIVSGISFALGYKTRVSNIVFAITYFVFAYYVGHFSTQLFSYITHLNFFSIILCFVRAERYWSVDWILSPELRNETYRPAEREFASFALAFMQLYLVAFYVQAGLSKLYIGGTRWFLTGATPYYGSIVSGTKPGLALTKYRWVFTAVSMFTGLFELGFFLVLWKRTRLIYALGVIPFHLGIFSTMNIYFFQLSGVVPLFFLFYDPRNNRRAVAGLGVYFFLLAALMSQTPLSAHPLGTSG